MKLLHTSDWHLGRTLYAKKERQEEHTAFFNWLLKTIIENKIDLLIVAGDIFDTPSPSSHSQKIYYDFLKKVIQTGCQNVVIVGGNHDSPSFLNAPKDILAVLHVCVVGNASENPEDEVVEIIDSEDETIAVVCAVPFLRERDLSRFIEGETCTDRSKRIADNIKKHYEKVAEIADNKRKTFGKNIPVIATGHLSVVGGKTIHDDGVRETYFGNIECVSSEIFPKIFDYVALGHYHIPCTLKETVRYSGSPIPMGFGEAEQNKSVYIVDFYDNNIKIETKVIPVFQKLASICGDKLFIENRLSDLKKIEQSVWVEIIYDGNELFPDFTSWAKEQVTGSKIEILKLQNRQYLAEVLTPDNTTQSLDELEKFEVFDIMLEKKGISEEQKEELHQLYKEITFELINEG